MTPRVFRIFLSSTFGDFQAERETLRARVWPKLEHYCLAKGAAFEVVDLRWGVSEADGLSHETLRICLDEVAHCQKLSPKPNFLMLIGDRYGWCPLPTEIPVEEFEAILHVIGGHVESVAILNHWYRRDDNAIPPHYKLLPRDVAHQSVIAWSNVETRLIALLRASAQKLGITPGRRERYFLSATHLEIVRGVLSIENADEHVFAFIRDIDGIESLSPSQITSGRFTDYKNGELDQGAAQLRTELRGEIGSVIPTSHRYRYQCEWTGEEENPITTSHIEALCADVERSLRDLIDRQLENMVVDSLEQEIEWHEQFAIERAAMFIGREKEISQLTAWADEVFAPSNEATEDTESHDAKEHKAQSSTPPLIVHGIGGVGKSAFMARAIATVQTAHPQAVVIRRFVGASPQSINLYAFLSDLLRELSRRYSQPESPPEGNLKVLIEELPKRLAWATIDKPLILAIDALDQFTECFEARHHQWLPREIPHQVAIVMSVLDGPVCDYALKYFPTSKELKLPVFTSKEGGYLLDTILLAGEDIAPDRKRRLTKVQREAVLNTFAADGRPLYLKIAASFVRRWSSWMIPETLPDSLEGVIHLMVKRLHAVHGTTIADRALDYLSASRFGVSDNEIRELLWRDADAHAEFDLRKNKDQPSVDSLPPVIWSRIYFEIAPYLTTNSVDGTLLHTFFHRVIGEEISKVCLADDASLVHSRIADYFADHPIFIGEGTDKSPNLRKLMEEPWQRIQAGEFGKAEALISDFDFAMAKCQANRFDDLLSDYRLLIARMRERGIKLSLTFSIWEEFIRSKAHLLRRGNDAWPSHKILLQLAMEHADDSAVTMSAENFIKKGYCNWHWLKCNERPERYIPSSLMAVLEGHTGVINGAKFFPDGRVLSWSWDRTLRVWDGETGALQSILEGHTKSVNGAEFLKDGRILSWSNDGTLRLWKGDTGAALAVLHGHHNLEKPEGLRPTLKSKILPDGRILSWSDDGTLRIWNSETGDQLIVMAGHKSGVYETLLIPGGRLLSGGYDGTLCIWDMETDTPLTILEGHEGIVNGVDSFSDGRILTWSDDASLRIWNDVTGAHLVTMKGHDKKVNGAFIYNDGKVISWSDDGTLRTWDSVTGKQLALMVGHEWGVKEAKFTAKGYVLSWSNDGTLRLWNEASGVVLSVMKHPHLSGCYLFHDGTILSWGTNGDLRFWSEEGEFITLLKNRTAVLIHVEIFNEDRILSWSTDGTLELSTNFRTEEKFANFIGHTDMIKGVQILDNWKLLSWSQDNTLRLWDISEKELVIGSNNDASIIRVAEIFDGKILSLLSDNTLQLSDSDSCKQLARMTGHTSQVNGAKIMSDGRIMSWSDDGTLRIWNSETGDQTLVMGELQEEDYDSGVSNAIELKCGNVLSWSHGGPLRIWNSATGDQLFAIGEQENEVRNAIELDDGRVLAWSFDGMLQVYNPFTRLQLTLMEVNENSSYDKIKVPDCQILASFTDKTIRIWNDESGELLHAMNVGMFKTGNLDKKRFISVSEEGSMQICYGNSGECQATMEGHSTPNLRITILTDGRIVSWSTTHYYDNSLRLWDSNSGVQLGAFKMYLSDIDDVEALPGGRLIAWSINEAVIFNEQGEILGKLSLNDTDVLTSRDEVYEMNKRLCKSSSGDSMAWTKIDRIVWMCQDRELGELLYWHDDKGNNIRIISTTNDSCVLQTKRNFTKLQLM